MSCGVASGAGRAVCLGLAVLLASCAGKPDNHGDEAGPDDELAVALAETLIKAGAHSNAVPILRRAMARKPKDARLRYLMGTVLRDRGVYEQAAAEFALAISIDPRLSPAHSGLAIVHDLKGEHAEAQKLHAKAIALNPEVARFHNNLGFSHYLAGDMGGAIKAYRAALRIDPSARPVYLNLGFALAAEGKDEEAVRMFRQAVDEAAALNNLALAHELRGQEASARRHYEESLAIDPGLEQAIANLKALDEAEAGADPKEKE